MVRMATYSTVRTGATEALFTAVVGAGIAVDWTMLFVDKVYAGWMGEGRCHCRLQRVVERDAKGRG